MLSLCSDSRSVALCMRIYEYSASIDARYEWRIVLSVSIPLYAYEFDIPVKTTTWSIVEPQQQEHSRHSTFFLKSETGNGVVTGDKAMSSP